KPRPSSAHPPPRYHVCFQERTTRQHEKGRAVLWVRRPSKSRPSSAHPPPRYHVCFQERTTRQHEKGERGGV
ncbi:unnamed protein product, partial [Ectocarpus sp. 12 AP-2014]